MLTNKEILANRIVEIYPPSADKTRAIRSLSSLDENQLVELEAKLSRASDKAKRMLSIRKGRTAEKRSRQHQRQPERVKSFKIASGHAIPSKKSLEEAIVKLRENIGSITKEIRPMFVAVNYGGYITASILEQEGVISGDDVLFMDTHKGINFQKIRGNQVVIVDDIVRSGRTIREVSEKLAAHDIKVVAATCLFADRNSVSKITDVKLRYSQSAPHGMQMPWTKHRSMFKGTTDKEALKVETNRYFRKERIQR